VATSLTSSGGKTLPGDRRRVSLLSRVPARQSVGSRDQLVEQFAENVPGGDRFAVRLGDTGLPGAEPAIFDDHVRMLLAELLSGQFVRPVLRLLGRGREYVVVLVDLDSDTQGGDPGETADQLPARGRRCRPAGSGTKR